MFKRIGLLLWLLGMGITCDSSSSNNSSSNSDNSITIEVGTEYDIDGDGISDGIAVDTTNNGQVNGLDSDNDGEVDIALLDDGWDVDLDGSADYDLDGNLINEVDSDNDGVLDLQDAFPTDASETVDSDGDGVGDNSDAFPNDADESSDTDGDGIGDNADECFADASKTNGTDSDNNGYCENADGFGGGNGSSGEPWVVHSAGQLQKIDEDLTAYYQLEADIDMDGVSFEPIGYESGTNCASSSIAFTGDFDGQNNTISNFTLSSGAAGCYGLFGKTNGADIKNLTMSNVSVEFTGSGFQDYTGALAGHLTNATTVTNVIVNSGTITSGGDYTGGLVGFNDNSTITNSGSAADVDGNNFVGGLAGRSTGTIDGCYGLGDITVGFDAGGGLVAWNEGGAISNSYATGDVTGPNEGIGGLVGLSDSSGTIDRSYATGNITAVFNSGGLIGISTNTTVTYSYASGDVNGSNNLGGLGGSVDAGSTISYSFAFGDVNGSGNNNGGLVGDHSGDINDSFATGSVDGNSAIGGLVGRLEAGSSIVYGYAIGLPTGSSDIGGLVGWDGSGTSTVTDSFFNSEVYATSPAGTGKTTAELLLSSTFTDDNWDFAGESTNGSNDYWSISGALNCGYPYILEVGSPGFDCP